MNRRAFTLVEIVVVICIVAILAGLSLPAVQRAKRQGILADGWAKMRQTSAAIQLYRIDHSDSFPSVVDAGLTVPKEAQCHKLDNWVPSCALREEKYMVGSWGYAPADEQIVPRDGCLLVNVFAAQDVMAPFYLHEVVSLDDPCIVAQTCMMPDRLEFIGTDGSLKIKRMHYWAKFASGPFTIFGWGHAFDLCREAYGSEFR